MPETTRLARRRFGPYTFDPRSGELFRDGAPVPLQHQPARVLAYLIAHSGVCVTRDEIHEHIWGAHHINFDQGLNYCIRQIRKALGENAATAVYIQTVGRSGYKWIAALEDADARAVLTSAVPLSRRPVPLWAAIAMAAFAVVATAALHHIVENGPHVVSQSGAALSGAQTGTHLQRATAAIRSLEAAILAPGTDPDGAKSIDAIRTLWNVTASHVGLASDPVR